MNTNRKSQLTTIIFVALLTLLFSSLACTSVPDLVDLVVGRPKGDNKTINLAPADPGNGDHLAPADTENDGGLASIYVGEPPIPVKVQEAQQDPGFSNITIDANYVMIRVDKDGTTNGEKVLKYSYTAIGENDEPVHVSSSWRISFEGILLEPPYQLYAIFDYHFLSPERDDSATMEIVYDIQVSGDIMSGVPSEVNSMIDDFSYEIFVFEATKQ